MVDNHFPLKLKSKVSQIWREIFFYVTYFPIKTYYGGLKLGLRNYKILLSGLRLRPFKVASSNFRKSLFGSGINLKKLWSPKYNLVILDNFEAWLEKYHSRTLQKISVKN